MHHNRIAIIIILSALVTFATACGRTGADKQTTGRPTSAVKDFTTPLRLSTPGTDAAEPSMAAAADGSIYVSWVEHRAKREADVMLVRLDENGQALSKPVRVNPKAGEATAWRGDPPSIATAQDGTVYMAWTGRAAAEGHATHIFFSTSRDQGRTFEPPVKVNDDQGLIVHGMHSLAVDKGGRIYLTWLDERNVKVDMDGEKGKMDEHKMEANREVYVASSADGGRTFSRNVMVAREACPCCKTAITTASDGRVYVAWRQVLPGNYRHIAVSSSTDAGQSFSQSVIASDDKWMIEGCPVSGPALAALSDNAQHLRVLWYSAGEAGSPGLYWSESVDGGKTFTSRKLVTEGASFGNPQLLAGPGKSLTAIWESHQQGGSKIIIARLDSDGAPAVSELPSQGQLPTATLARDQLFITYITKQNEQRSIWFVRARPLA